MQLYSINGKMQQELTNPMGSRWRWCVYYVCCARLHTHSSWLTQHYRHLPPFGVINSCCIYNAAHLHTYTTHTRTQIENLFYCNWMPNKRFDKNKPKRTAFLLFVCRICIHLSIYNLRSCIQYRTKFNTLAPYSIAGAGVYIAKSHRTRLPRTSIGIAILYINIYKHWWIPVNYVMP